MAENTSNAPRASTLMFLFQLYEQQVTAKVRFLCCVLSYDANTGCLLVEHKYTQHSTFKGQMAASIDVNLVLEGINPVCLQRGSWINVVGYVEHVPNAKLHVLGSDTMNANATNLCRVQAVLIWDAGAIRLDKYEEVLKQHLALHQ